MTMKGYKAYDHGLVCRGKQYEVGKTYEEDEAIICEKGMHYCDNLMDLMTYHDLIDENGEVMEVTEVEDMAESRDSKVDCNSKKYCTTKLKVGAKIEFSSFVRGAVEFLFEKCKGSDNNDNGENSAQLASSGDSAQLASSGHSAQLASSGDYARLASSGDSAQLASSGYSAQLASSGDYARLASSGDYSVVAAIGTGSCAKAVKGNWITLAEWRYDENVNRWVPICVKTERVDGERIKADVFYKLEGGEFVEVS